MKPALATLLAALLVTAAVHSAHSFSGLGSEFSRLGTRSKGKPAAPLVSCASTGVFNLNNVCNDIYLLTGSL